MGDDKTIANEKAKAEEAHIHPPHSSLAALTSLSEWGLNVTACRISILLALSHP
ncbi:hypothetical protein [Brucella intermedia]|uniref:hypothetical protein n=1 Tax=Brucella intermedia TaxID=94625 RepID=UPI00224AAB37|nr:hypothetical protein [Brucella intermedia]